MFSPQDRIYNTPDISVPAAEAILQQIRLERVLERFGYFSCSEPSAFSSGRGVEPPLVTLGPPAPTRGLRPFGAHEVFTGWQKSRNVQIPSPQKCEKSSRSGIRGAPTDDPFLQKPRDTVGGCKYGGVHLTDYGLKPDVQRPDIFKPFQPQKSPLRLPTIQREINQESDVKNKLPLTDIEINKHVRLHKKKNTTLQKKQQTEMKNKRKRNIEMEFLKWEENHASYYQHPGDALYAAAHDIQGSGQTTDEQSYRDRIATGIKQGVRDRMESFGQSGQFASGHNTCTKLIPIKEMKFGYDELQKPRKSHKQYKNKM